MSLAPEFPHDVLTLIGLGLADRGHSDVAARVFAETAAHGRALKRPEVALNIARCMARARRVVEALRISESLIVDVAGARAAQMLALPAVAHGRRLTSSELSFCNGVLEQVAAVAEGAGDKLLAATAHYNTGNFLRGIARHAALKHYRTAAYLDPSYLTRGYFNRELAGILFGAGRFRLSAAYYEVALTQGEDSLCGALHADAVLHTGHYSRARGLLAEAVAVASEAAAHFRLKIGLCDELARLGIGDHTRQVLLARAQVGVAIAGDPAQVEPTLRTALGADGLCAHAWFNLGIHRAQLGQQDEAAIAFIAAAVLNVNDLEAWCLAATHSALSKAHAPMLPDVLHDAYWAVGEQLLPGLIEIFRAQPQGFPVTEMTNAMATVIGTLGPRREPFTVRFTG